MTIGELLTSTFLGKEVKLTKKLYMIEKHNCY